MPSKTIVLKSSDGETFKVEEAVALESQKIKRMIEDDCADTTIPLPNVTSKILSKVIEYCKRHVESPKNDDKPAEEDLKAFDAEFVKVDQETLFDLILAANYLNIKSLLYLTCQTVADMIKCKTPEYSRFQENRLFLSSCNGLTLVCLSHDDDHGTTLGVIDPLRKKCYELPTIENWRGESAFVRSPNSAGIGFDDFTNTFKVVSVFPRDHIPRNLCTMVHVFGTDSWREIAQVPPYPIMGEGVYSNGCLHWLVSHWSPNGGRKIVRFDVNKEEFGMIDPPKQKGRGWINDQLVDLNGEVGFVYNNIEKISLEVWILKQNKWVIHTRIVKPTSWNGPIRVSGCWNKDGDLLLTLDHGGLLVYGLKTGKVHQVDREDDCEADIHIHRNNLLLIQNIILQQNEWVIHSPIVKPTSSNGTIRVSGCCNDDGDLLVTLDHEKRVFFNGVKTGKVHQVDREDDCEADIHIHRNSLNIIRWQSFEPFFRKV